ncbi:MAG: diacylglycerol kinase family protein [Asgard group archaeon]|nr:diacylglycerol kinase family protein [Asgard group archaeon]
MADTTPFLIINPNSNNRKTEKKIDKILNFADEIFGDYHYELTSKMGDGIPLAQKAKDSGYSKVVAIGGDGTLNEVSNVLVNTDIKLGMIPTGGSCDAHKTHGIPREIKESLEIVAEGYSEKFPAGLARGDTDRYFIDMTDGAFTGACAEAAHTRMKWLHGDMRYILLAFQMALRFKPIYSSITVDDQQREGDISVFAVALSNVLAGFEIIPENHPRKGDFAVIICRDYTRLRLMYQLARALKGKHVTSKKVEILRGKHVVIDSEKPMTWEAEGEIYSKTSKRVEFEYIPNALNLIIPKDWQYGFCQDKKKLSAENVQKAKVVY